MSNQSVKSTLRSLGRLNGASSKYFQPTPRQFSTTCSRGVRSTFMETENAELNHILKSIQEKIILPALLPAKQRKTVFDLSKRAHLEQNPIVLEIEDLEYKFSPINRFKDVPNSKLVLRQALDKMKTEEDWKNLAILLAGYKTANIKLKDFHWSTLIRLACTSGNTHAIIDCAKQAEETGINISAPGTTATILSFINDANTANELNIEESERSLKWSEAVLDLLQRPQHTPKEHVSARDRVHNNVLIRGMVLFAHASAAKAAQQAESLTEKQQLLLKDEVDLLTSLWGDSYKSDLKSLPDIATLYPQKQANPKKIESGLSAWHYIRVGAQNIQALSLVQELLGNEAKHLQPIQAAIESHLKEVASQHPTRPKGWDEAYTSITGRAPNW